MPDNLFTLTEKQRAQEPRPQGSGPDCGASGPAALDGPSTPCTQPPPPLLESLTIECATCGTTYPAGQPHKCSPLDAVRYASRNDLDAENKKTYEQVAAERGQDWRDVAAATIQARLGALEIIAELAAKAVTAHGEYCEYVQQDFHPYTDLRNAISELRNALAALKGMPS